MEIERMKTIKRKKILIVVICFSTLCLMCLAQGLGFARAQTHPDSTNLINPSSICVDRENNVFVADQTGESSVIYRFTANTRTVIYEDTHNAFSRIRYGGGKVFGLYDNTLVVIENIVTLNYFKLTAGTSNEKLVGIDANNDYLFCLVQRVSDGDFIVCRIPLGGVTGSLSIINYGRFELDDASDISVNSSTIYLLCKNQGKLARYDIDSAVSTKTDVAGYVNRVYAYDRGNGSSAYMLFDDAKIDGNEALFNGKPMKIADVAYFNKNNLYILDISTNNGLKMVARFDFETVLTQTDVYIGSNSLEGAAPLAVGSSPSSDELRLARATGYPSNIVYTVDPAFIGSGDGKIPERLCMKGHVLDGATLFLILNYKSATDYYFIFYNVKLEGGKSLGQCGWIEKNPAVVLDEASLSDNVFEDCEQLGQSLRLYSLPSATEDYVIRVFSGDPSAQRQSATVVFDLWAFDAQPGSVKWKYVLCNGEYGFALASELSERHDQSTAVRVKANPPFGKSLPLYQSRDKNSLVIASLNSGEDMLLIKNLGELSFVSVYVNGTWEYGYVDSAMYITKGLTNNQALGITLSVAFILIVGFIAFVVIRKRKFSKKDDSPDD